MERDSWRLCNQESDPICGAPPTRPHHLPKAPPPDSMALGIPDNPVQHSTAACPVTPAALAQGMVRAQLEREAKAEEGTACTQAHAHLPVSPGK